MKVALAADWLYVFGGAEHVLAEFQTLYPDAPIFTTICKQSGIGPLSSAKIHTSFLQKWYTLFGRHEVLLPWMPQAMESFDLNGYDVILSSSHAIGKGVIPPSNTRHICYCHTPMRYAWEMEDEYINDFHIPNFLRRRVKRELSRLRRWDLTSAKRVDTFIANSHTVRKRIQDTYNRDAVVIHPPVDGRFFAHQEANRSKDYYLAVGRFVPYKRFDLLVELANKEKLPLKIVGTGREGDRLKAMAGDTVEFLDFVPSDALPHLYANAKAVFFPPFEDAGIVPLEAQASGTPVIAFGKGGALDVIADGTTGLFFAEQSVESLRDAVQRFETKKWDSEAIKKHAEQFSAENFRKSVQSVITQNV